MVHRNVCVLTSLQTEESRTTGIHRMSSVMIVAHAHKSAGLLMTGITRADPSNGMLDRQIMNLGVETNLVAPRGASFRSNSDL